MLKQFLNKSKLKDGIRAVQIESVWADVMGKTITRYTDKIEIINTTLFIRTSVGPLKQELVYQKDKSCGAAIFESVNSLVTRDWRDAWKVEHDRGSR